MNQSHSNPVESKLVARRRLLRGSFAAPAVLSLHAGGVMGAPIGSNAITLARTPGPNAKYVTVTSWVLDDNINAQGQRDQRLSYWIKGSDVKTALDLINPAICNPSLMLGTGTAGSFFDAATEGYVYQAGTSSPWSGKTPSFQLFPVPTKNQALTQGAPVYLLIDAQGNLTGVSTTPTTHALVASAWTSFARAKCAA